MNPGYSGYSLPAPPITAFVPLPPPPGGAEDGSFPGLQPLESEIDAVRTVIDYQCYRLSNRAAYNNTDADFSIHKLKRKGRADLPNLGTVFRQGTHGTLWVSVNYGGGLQRSTTK